jgi:putative copper export protein
MAESPLALLVVLRFIHVMAAALWVGGGIVVLAARTAANTAPLTGTSSAALGHAVGRLVGTGVAVFVLTGALLAFNRLAEQSIDAAYVAVLAGKVLLTLGMFRLAVPRRRRVDPRAAQAPSRPWWQSRTALIVALGLAAYLLSLILNEMAELGFRSVG